MRLPAASTASTWTLKDALWSRRTSPQRFAEEAAAARQFSAVG
jgi:hypothetical protein